VKNRVLPINSLPDCLIVSDVSADLFTVQKPAVRVEFQVKECNRISSGLEFFGEVAADEPVSSSYQSL
jgi:hypothetical protein